MFYYKKKKVTKLLFCIIIFFSGIKLANADFFKNISSIINDNKERLSYGISVNDINSDGNYEFIVTGFGTENIALSYENGFVSNVIEEDNFADVNRRTIGVVSCDIDRDGYEEIYFLNTDSYSGEKLYTDRLLDNKDGQFQDLFLLNKNKEQLNYTAGRSVACVDRKGNGKYGIYVANYGGPTRFYELDEDRLVDKAPSLNLDKITGGRAVVVGNIITNKSDIFAANERGANFLYENKEGLFLEVAKQFGVDDKLQNGRGTTLSDILYNGQLDIISGNWEGYHRAFVRSGNKFIDIAKTNFNEPSRVRTVISADFDNDGYDEVFFNNIGEANKLFKIDQNGEFIELKLGEALEPNGLGTGAAVADIDNDGVLELLISHGEVAEQTLSMFKANTTKDHRWLRVKPLNTYRAPARGATVKLHTDQRIHAKTIDAGSGYLCQMEPVAHYGIRENEVIKKVEVIWTNGSTTEVHDLNLNSILEIRQK